ncbi:MAG: contact-dependent growth inhibition system immunity protein [Aurantimonas endophytica]|uniref:contact-dependent growth inhibition system immunity protein n=1 Tax=Aurantimonas endophytica TaxID=1522175 RepID=UPI003002B2F9
MKDTIPASPPPPERKEAEVTAFRKLYRIHSWAVYRDSLLDPDGYDRIHSGDLDDHALGAAAREALVASRYVAPDHPDWDRVRAYWDLEKGDKLEEQLRAAAGVKTNSALYKGAGNVHLDLRGGTIAIDPMKYAGRGGFDGIRGLEPTKLPEAISDEALGAAIRAAIEISRAPWKR